MTEQSEMAADVWYWGSGEITKHQVLHGPWHPYKLC